MLRGINLGSRNRVSMARLRGVCEAADGANVGRATLPGLALSKVQPPVTIRNWRTVVALDRLAREDA